MSAFRTQLHHPDLFRKRVREKGRQSPSPFQQAPYCTPRVPPHLTEQLATCRDDLGAQCSPAAPLTCASFRSMHDYLPGMEVRLLPHQLIGVSWMVDQERNTPIKAASSQTTWASARPYK